MPRFRVPPVALRNVVRGGTRSIAAIAGIAFTATMVLLELGFLGAVRKTAAGFLDALEFDAAIIAPVYDQVYDSGRVPLDRFTLARGAPFVSAVRPIALSFADWRCPERRPQGSGTIARFLGGAGRPLQYRELLAIGIDLEDPPFREPIKSATRRALFRLREPRRVLMNELSNPDFGWSVRDRVSAWEMNGTAVNVVGGFRLVRGFAADGAVITSLETFHDVSPWFGSREASMGLVEVEPGRIDEALEGLRRVLPPDAVAVSRGALVARETDHWVNQTSTGKLFSFGVLVSAMTAAAVVYQVLSNDIRARINEYATLKAIGYSYSSLALIVITQALIYAVVASPPALLFSWGLYIVTERFAGIPMQLAGGDIALTFGLVISVSALGSLLTIGRLRSADPANLY